MPQLIDASQCSRGACERPQLEVALRKRGTEIDTTDSRKREERRPCPGGRINKETVPGNEPLRDQDSPNPPWLRGMSPPIYPTFTGPNGHFIPPRYLAYIWPISRHSSARESRSSGHSARPTALPGLPKALESRFAASEESLERPPNDRDSSATMSAPGNATEAIWSSRAARLLPASR